MLVAIIADTHMRERTTLPAVCVHRLRGADLILHAGDVCSQGAMQALQRIGPVVRAVAGNVDEPALRNALPATLELELAGARVAMLHDAGPARGRLARLRARFPGAEAVIFGHSHMPARETGEDGFQIFNPGSPTQRRRAPFATMGLADIHHGAVCFRHVRV